ncbi:MAG: hypothetical protein DRQ59_09015 [Gammaproteobacteria bacterium]|nr:MAG: hypothetical protein DRQ59_09015 [Gammaproteobacteria bacterium]
MPGRMDMLRYLILVLSMLSADLKATDAPANAHRYEEPVRFTDLEIWQCDRGYALSHDSRCVLPMPSESRKLSADGRLVGPRCNIGYRNMVCVKVIVPENAHLDIGGTEWFCKRGFRRRDNRCEEITVADIPANAKINVDLAGGWKCNSGYFRNLQGGCDKMIISENGKLAYHGNGWACNKGFKPRENGCTIDIDHSLDCNIHRKIATIAETTEVINCIAKNSTQPGFEPASALKLLAQQPDKIPLDFTALKNALPSYLSRPAKTYYIKIISQRREEEGIPVLLKFLPEDLKDVKYSLRILEAVLDIEVPEAWEQARKLTRTLYDKGEITEKRYKYTIYTLDKHIKNPEVRYKDKRRQLAEKSLSKESNELDVEARNLSDLKDSNPEQYVVRYGQYLAKLTELAQKYSHVPASNGLRSSIQRKYYRLADFTRIRLEKPDQAISLYQLSTIGEGDIFTHIIIADIYYFDLNNPKKALEHYQRSLISAEKVKPKRNDVEASFSKFNTSWVNHEISFIETGNTFKGILTREDIGAFTTFIYLSGGNTNFEPALLGGSNMQDSETISRMLNLPPSHFSLFKALNYLSLLDQEKTILQFLNKHDPAGFLSASLFSLALFTEAKFSASESEDNQSENQNKRHMQYPAFRQAAKTFLASRNVSLKQPDKNKDSPENTWNLLMRSLKSNDLETALSCLTPGLRNRWKPLWFQMTEEDLGLMVDSVKGFSLTAKIGEIREAAVIITSEGENFGNFVYFVNVGGEWLIKEM